MAFNITEVTTVVTMVTDALVTAGEGYGGVGGGDEGGVGGVGGARGFDPSLPAKIAAIAHTRDRLIAYIYTPVMVFGLLGNTLSFLVMIKKTARSSTHNYLCALSVLDSIFLLTSVLGWLISYFFLVDIRVAIDCNIVLLLNRVPKHSSAWLLVVITLERLLVVWCPTKARQITNIRVARLAILLVILVNCGFEWVCFGAYYTKKDALRFDYCKGRTETIRIYLDKHAWTRAAVYSFIPSISLIIINALMASRFLASARKNKTKVTPRSTESGVKKVKKIKVKAAGQQTGSEVATTTMTSQADTNDVGSRTMTRYSRRMTITATMLSLTYLVLTVPESAHFVWFNVNEEKLMADPLSFHWQFLYKQMLAALFHLNHAINFALYCMTSATFRKESAQLLTCKKYKTHVTTSTGDETL